VDVPGDAGGDTVIAVTADHQVREGDEVTLAVGWGQVQVFGGPDEPGPRLGAAAAVPETAVLTEGAR